MALNFLHDDNGTPLHDGTGLRPDFAHKASASTGAAVAELDISGMNIAANRNQQNEVLLRVSVIGSNACYFSLGAAGAAPSDNTTMMALQANSTTFMRAKSTDLSAYHQQITGSSTIEVLAVA